MEHKYRYTAWIMFGVFDGVAVCDSDSKDICINYINEHKEYFNDVTLSVFDNLTVERVYFIDILNREVKYS